MILRWIALFVLSVVIAGCLGGKTKVGPSERLVIRFDDRDFKVSMLKNGSENLITVKLAHGRSKGSDLPVIKQMLAKHVS